MIAALIIMFREVVEAGLIVGIVLAATRAVPGRNGWIAGGFLGGIAGSLFVAYFANALSALFEGAGQELFNAGVLSLAVVMLVWHNIWMARHGRELAAEFKAAGAAVRAGSKTLLALAIVVGVAVLREGAEAVLFLYGVAVSDTSSKAELLTGGFAGLALGGAISALTYAGLLRIPPHRLFAVTTVLLSLLAAGMASQAVDFLHKAGVTEFLSQTAWDSSALLSDASLAGRALHTLIGYTDRPSALQLVTYVATLAAIYVLTRVFSAARAPAAMRLAAASIRETLHR
jgi:high-affinity iron transporter